MQKKKGLEFPEKEVQIENQELPVTFAYSTPLDKFNQKSFSNIQNAQNLQANPKFENFKNSQKSTPNYIPNNRTMDDQNQQNVLLSDLEKRMEMQEKISKFILYQFEHFNEKINNLSSKPSSIIDDISLAQLQNQIKLSNENST